MPESMDTEREKPVEGEKPAEKREHIEDLEPDRETSGRVAGGLNPQPFPPLQ